MLKLFQRPVNRAARNSCGLRYCRYTTVSQRTRLQSSSQAKLPLVEMGHQRQQSILKYFCTRHIPRLSYGEKLFKLFCGRSKAVAKIVPLQESDGVTRGARTALVKRLRSERVTKISRWSREELYEDQP